MKKILTLFFALFSPLAFADWSSSTSTPATPFVCVRNTTSYNLQVLVNRSPIYVASRWTTTIRTFDFQPIIMEMNTKQVINHGHNVWASKYLRPSVYGCDYSNTVAIGMTNYGHLFFD